MCENTSEIDDKTDKSLIEVSHAIKKFRKLVVVKKSVADTPAITDMLSQLSDDCFDYRSYIHCRLCDVSIEISFEQNYRKSKIIFPGLQEQICLTLNDFERHQQSPLHQSKCHELQTGVVCDQQPKTPTTLPTPGLSGLQLLSTLQKIRKAGLKAATDPCDPKVSSPNQSPMVAEDQNIFTLIASEYEALRTRMPLRDFGEKRIIGTIIDYLYQFDPELVISRFGSSTYGIGGAGTDLNIVIDARK